jgi:hypothetical protein
MCKQRKKRGACSLEQLTSFIYVPFPSQALFITSGLYVSIPIFPICIHKSSSSSYPSSYPSLPVFLPGPLEMIICQLPKLVTSLRPQPTGATDNQSV